MTTNVDDFLVHYGVLGMHWGQRKAEPVSAGRTAGKKPGGKGLSSDHKKFLLGAAAAVGGASVLIGGLFLGKKLSSPKLVADLTRTSIESGEKVVSNLIKTASQRPAFSVNGTGLTKALNHDSANQAAQLRTRIKELDLKQSITFLRNENNVAAREGLARYRAETFSRIMDDPKLSFPEASKRISGVNEMLNNSWKSYIAK